MEEAVMCLQANKMVLAEMKALVVEGEAVRSDSVQLEEAV